MTQTLMELPTHSMIILFHVPLARVLDRLGADERAAFLKAMDMLEAEFRTPEL